MPHKTELLQKGLPTATIYITKTNYFECSISTETFTYTLQSSCKKSLLYILQDKAKNWAKSIQC